MNMSLRFFNNLNGGTIEIVLAFDYIFICNNMAAKEPMVFVN